MLELDVSRRKDFVIAVSSFHSIM